MMHGTRYREVLEDKLDFFMNQHGITHFLQDRAPCPRSKVMKDWFVWKHNAELIKWFGNSPDLILIENVWD
jgi:hypothetical protein